MTSTWLGPEGDEVTDQFNVCPQDRRPPQTGREPDRSAVRDGGQGSALDASIRPAASGTPQSRRHLPKAAKEGPRSIITATVVTLIVLGAGIAAIVWAVSRGGGQSDAVSNWARANEQTFADIPAEFDTSTVADCSSLTTVMAELRGVPPPPDARLAAHLSNAIDRLNTATSECADHQVDAFNDEIAAVDQLRPLAKALQ